MAPHLLTLPREIRNSVYDHLTKPVSFVWLLFTRKKLASFRSPKAFEVSTVKLEHCPYFRLLLTNHQPHAEYKEAKCFTELTLNLSLEERREREAAQDRIYDNKEASKRKGVITYSSRDVLWKERGAQRIAAAVLATVRHATIQLNLPVFLYKEDNRGKYVPELYNFLGNALSEMNNLATLRIAYRQGHRQSVPDWVLASTIKQAHTRQAFFPSLPTNIGRLSMVQQGEGYRIGSAATTPWEGGSYAPHSRCKPTFVLEGTPFVIHHAVAKLGVYLYCADDRNKEKHLWSAEDVRRLAGPNVRLRVPGVYETFRDSIRSWGAHGAFREYLATDLEHVPLAKARMLVRFPFELIEW
ncbi:hypothetical protein EK21DRAFT_91073 [Setomelanomma holmii]|uniref:Uncharacterized protein n=1 Tax=Setomelanomma holmii TaxID=210430 RepID=A0A9P4H6R3_9PLEO|nr:hypothetical protein EK21DRAFT_91073 [Setomelanomma holmii]